MSTGTVSGHQEEVAAGRRFPFGKNWKSFLARLDDDRVNDACHSLRELLGLASLEGKTFLDVGSGSGLSSLAAMQLGARETLSFDYDPDSVSCTREVKRRYSPGDGRWRSWRVPFLIRISSHPLDGSTSSSPGVSSTTPGPCGRPSTTPFPWSSRAVSSPSRSTTTRGGRAPPGAGSSGSIAGRPECCARHFSSPRSFSTN